jgi:hypothetical protein
MTDDAPSATDFGAPIIAGPFEAMRDAQAWIDVSDLDGLDIYWERSSWYVHGPADHGDDPPLTTYGT